MVKREIYKIYLCVVQNVQKFMNLIKKIMKNEKTKIFHEILLRSLFISFGLAIFFFIVLIIFEKFMQESFTTITLSFIIKRFLGLTFLSYIVILMINIPRNTLKEAQDPIIEIITIPLCVMFLLIWLLIWMEIGLNPNIYFGIFFIVSVSLIILLISYVKLALECSSFIVGILAILFYYVLVICITGLYFGVYYAFTFYHLNLNSENINYIKILKIAIPYFYEFPSKEFLCKISLLQFYFGKILDIIFTSFVIGKTIEKASKQNLKLLNK